MHTYESRHTCIPRNTTQLSYLFSYVQYKKESKSIYITKPNINLVSLGLMPSNASLALILKFGKVMCTTLPVCHPLCYQQR